jgi:hypothetical protein
VITCASRYRDGPAVKKIVGYYETGLPGTNRYTERSVSPAPLHSEFAGVARKEHNPAAKLAI